MQNTTTQPVQSAPHTPAPYPFTEHDISDIADAMNFLLSALDCPRSVRVLIHAMTGFLAGRTNMVEFYHYDLGRRMYKVDYIEDFTEYHKARQAVEGRVRKAMQKFMEWRYKWNLPIEYTPGTMTREGEKVKSSIKMPLIILFSFLLQALLLQGEAQIASGFPFLAIESSQSLAGFLIHCCMLQAALLC